MMEKWKHTLAAADQRLQRRIERLETELLAAKSEHAQVIISIESLRRDVGRQKTLTLHYKGTTA